MRTRIRIDDFYFVVKQVYHNYLVSILVSNLMTELFENWKQNNEEISEEIVWEKIKEYSIGGKLGSFKYQNLMDQAESYKLTGTPLDTKIHPIDEFMVDVYRTFNHYESEIRMIDNSESMEELKMMGLERDALNLMKDFSRLKVVFNEIMLHFEFTETEIRGIQINYLRDMLKESVEIEDYETSALIRDRINNFLI